jgi:predicted RNA-binding protein YlxR (DUF448 family)
MSVVRSAGATIPYPVRTCMGCGLKLAKSGLVRLVVFEGSLVADKMQILPGRGVYCCRKAVCYQRLVKQRKKLGWALRYYDKGEVGKVPLSQGLATVFAIDQS